MLESSSPPHVCMRQKKSKRTFAGALSTIAPNTNTCISFAESGRKVLKVERTNLGRTFQNDASIYAHLQENKHISIRYMCEGGVGPVVPTGVMSS